MNLYIFNESSRAAVYGVGTYIRELSATLKDSDINVCIVHLRFEKPDNETAEPDDVCHLYIPPPINYNAPLFWMHQYELYYRNVVYLLRLHIHETERPVFHLNYNKSGKLAEELKKTFDCRIVVSAHYADWSFSVYDNLPQLRLRLKEERLDDFGKNLKKSFEEERAIYTKADRVICLSNYMFNILCQDYELDATKISIIPNGLTDTAKTKSDKIVLRKKRKIPTKEKIILFAGRMDEIKGLKYLINAFRNVLHVFPQSRLVIAGDGDFSKYTKESQDICSKITYTGLLDKEQLYEWYCLANLGVVPSLFEPFGYVAVEMMIHRLPIVATSTSGLNEVVDSYLRIQSPSY